MSRTILRMTKYDRFVSYRHIMTQTLTWHRGRWARRCWGWWGKTRKPRQRWSVPHCLYPGGWSAPKEGTPGSHGPSPPPTPHTPPCRSGRWSGGTRRSDTDQADGQEEHEDLIQIRQMVRRNMKIWYRSGRWSGGTQRSDTDQANGQEGQKYLIQIRQMVRRNTKLWYRSDRVSEETWRPDTNQACDQHEDLIQIRQSPQRSDRDETDDQMEYKDLRQIRQTFNMKSHTVYTYGKTKIGNKSDRWSTGSWTMHTDNAHTKANKNKCVW